MNIGKLHAGLSGYPVTCPICKSWGFYYISDRSGNFRLYTCKKCETRFVARWRGVPMTSCLSEVRNTRLSDWDWFEVIESALCESAIDVDYKVITEEFCDGSKPLELSIYKERSKV